jgi:predicted component of type VI protein secretion system
MNGASAETAGIGKKMTTTKPTTKEVVKIHNDIIARVEAKIKERMNKIKHNARLRQKMESDIKKSLGR